jgi:superfamily II DNA or RNA helicase
MMKEKRAFNLTERLALFDESGGYCCECGAELSEGWHADHIHPYAQGGETKVENGRALCPKCNLKKGSNVIETDGELELRDCQAKCMSIAIERYRAGHQTMAAYMSVASGKTLTGAIIAAWLLNAGIILRVIVVCPSESIARGWSNELSEQGLRVVLRDGNQRIGLDIADSEHGYITTYQSVASQPEQHRMKCLKRSRNGGTCRTLVIFDELHHLGEDPLSGEDRTKWAEKAVYAFGDATHILALTGTPDRSDSKALPFLKYVPSKDDPKVQVAELHYIYSYGEAVNDGYVRRCTFEYVGAEGDVTDENGNPVGRFATNESRSAGRGTVERASLNIKIKPDVSGKAAEDIIDRGIEMLRALKVSHARAAGLVICAGITHAQYVARMLRDMGQSCVLVHSKLDRANDIIDAFKRSSDDWIVAVGMVTEGVNIPRLRVCCYLTTITATLTLDQIMGRVVRVDWQDGEDRGEIQAFDDVGQPLPPAEAFFFCLDKPELVKWANDVEKEIQAHVHLPPENRTEGGGGGGGCFPPPELDILSLITKAAGGTAAGEYVEEMNLSLWKRFQGVNPGIRCQTHEGVKIIDFLRRSTEMKQSQDGAPQEFLAKAEDYTKKVNRLRKECHRIIGRIVKQHSLDRNDKSREPYRKLHHWANGQAGIQYEKNADADQLQRKKTALLEYEKTLRSAA